MKTQEELRKELNRLYCAASEQAGVGSWSDFARLVDVPYVTLYRYINSQANITESMLKRIANELTAKNVTFESSPITIGSNTAQNVNAPVTQTTNANDDRWFSLVAEKDAQISRLLGIIEKMQE